MSFAESEIDTMRAIMRAHDLVDWFNLYGFIDVPRLRSFLRHIHASGEHVTEVSKWVECTDKRPLPPVAECMRHIEYHCNALELEEVGSEMHSYHRGHAIARLALALSAAYSRRNDIQAGKAASWVLKDATMALFLASQVQVQNDNR